MALSLKKLEKILETKGLILKRYFTIGGMCVYIEILVIESADIFLLYIPSKYDIKAPESINSFKIKQLDINEDGTIPGNYTGEIDIDYSITLDPAKHENIEKSLVNNYNYPVTLEDISKKDMKDIREVLRQLKRLKLCIQTLKYKLCIRVKNYLCCVRRDNTFECFVIKNETFNKSERKLFVSIDLESLYTKLSSVVTDIKTVRDGVYSILDKNQIKLTSNLEKVLEYKTDFVKSSEFIRTRKNQLSKYLKELETMLKDLKSSEVATIIKINQINQQYNSEISIKGIHTDIQKVHLLSVHEKRITDINIVKQDIIRNIILIKNKLEDLSLKVDKVCFDNIVMINTIIRNFIDLTEININLQ